MGLVPKLETSCFCCTFKTGSFVTAWFLLVGSSVQTGYYAFLVDHMYPQKMCEAWETITVKADPPPYRDYDYDYISRLRGGYFDDFYYNAKNERPKKQEATIADKLPPNSNNTAQRASNNTAQHASNTTSGGLKNSSNAASSTEVSTKRTTQRRQYDRYRWAHFGFGPFWNFRPYPRINFVSRSYLRPCKRDYKPFDADIGFLDFDLRVPSFNKTILYFNIGIWATMMAATVLLMVGVYKDSEDLVTLWLVAETILLMVATASTVATASLMFGAVPVQIGIVTLLNMAIHLGLDIYFMIVVANYRRELITKGVDDKEPEAEQVVVCREAENGMLPD